MTDHPAIAAKCTKAQIVLFEQIASGKFSSGPVARLKKLLNAGLIQAVSDDDLALPLNWRKFEVPVPIHMQWREWCAENFED